MILVTVGHQVEINADQVFGRQRRGHLAIHAKAELFADRFAGIGEVRVKRRNLAARSLENETRLAQPPNRHRSARHPVRLDLLHRHSFHGNVS